MPVLINDKDCRTLVVDGDCAYELKLRDTAIFIDFEFVYSLMPEELKAGKLGEGEHCDAIRVSLSGDKLIVDLIELSMSERRGVEEYYRKFEYCLRFVDFLMGKIKEKGVKIGVNGRALEIRGLKLNAFIAVNPALVNKLRQGIKKMNPAWFFKELYNLYPLDEPVVVPCEKP